MGARTKITQDVSEPSLILVRILRALSAQVKSFDPLRAAELGLGWQFARTCRDLFRAACVPGPPCLLSVATVPAGEAGGQALQPEPLSQCDGCSPKGRLQGTRAGWGVLSWAPFGVREAEEASASLDSARSFPRIIDHEGGQGRRGGQAVSVAGLG